MYEKTVLVGHLGGDPELKFSSKGKPYCRFSLVTDRYVKGEKKPTWWRVTLFDSFAETAGQYLKKGSRVLVEGQIEPDDNGNPRMWQAKDGTWHASFEFVGRYMTMMDRRGEGQSGDDGGFTPDDDDDDIPF